VNLTRPQAKSLDAKVRAARGKLTADAEKLAGLVGQAERDQINVALACSWRGWYADAVGIAPKTLQSIQQK
jgi:hypothetical protein